MDNEQVNDSPAEEAGGKKKKGIGVNFKVSAKGAVSVYGLGRFPVTLYREQWLRLLEKTDDLKTFLDEHASELKGKAEAAAEAAAAAASTSEAAVEAATAPESTTPSGGAEGGEAQATPEAAREASPGPSEEVTSPEAKAATETGNPE